MLRALQARCLQSCGVGGNAWLGAPGIGGLTGCLEAPAQQGGVQHGLLSDRSNERAPYSSGAQTSGVLNRFYKEATVAQADGTPGLYNVLLDGKRVKTPAMRRLAVPSCMLAMAIAAEFQYQSGDLVRPITQPMFRLAWQAQDGAFTSQELIDKMLQFVDNDTVCVRHPDHGWGKQVAARQAEVYDPLVEWANSFFDVQLRVSASILGVEQDPDVVFAYAEYLAKLPYPQLVALAELTGACKSLLIGFALAEGIVSHEQGMLATRIEEDTQIEHFGLVEGGHDLDIVDLRTRVSGATLFIHMHRLDSSISQATVQRLEDVDKAMQNLHAMGF